mmetsp:Transcript_70126/g.146714  ORF Transcript_70126/g.146714 Transcript_70126/m.146714 type:complete len:103 (-) Transcript_70126:159-467(-)
MPANLPSQEYCISSKHKMEGRKAGRRRQAGSGNQKPEARLPPGQCYLAMKRALVHSRMMMRTPKHQEESEIYRDPVNPANPPDPIQQIQQCRVMIFGAGMHS